ncbi:MAG TPA: hypothetical protein VH138_13430 [Vicinamibacterales bacterium]|nr:hypothetical protein [Vicinamibacterales bacterium]
MTFTPAPVKPTVDPAVLASLDVRVGTIRAAAAVEATDRLALLTVDFGDHTRSIVAGIRTECPPLESIVGVQALFRACQYRRRVFHGTGMSGRRDHTAI